MTDEEYVREKYPDASAFGPVNLYWPGSKEKGGQDRKGVYIVTYHPSSSATRGVGNSIEESWKNAAERLRRQLEKPTVS